MPDEWQHGTRDSQAQSKKKKKLREIEACLVDQLITAILAEEKKKMLCMCVCERERMETLLGAQSAEWFL